MGKQRLGFGWIRLLAYSENHLQKVYKNLGVFKCLTNLGFSFKKIAASLDFSCTTVQDLTFRFFIENLKKTYGHFLCFYCIIVYIHSFLDFYSSLWKMLPH